ncbi:hypothetical protein KGF56_001756 [Candida oxycetoniae]|uniref:Uncharacterized protein n=1 Tax=Candida oxycetoniae TaxID=497107 RepID=A0AAI9WZ18_9ASCO|nr:uncharacterized protein KGF56_001756 [Candida oxycetoniae]KAI3405440.1 hypothetical protein KGF56_001756 [Candida oxycetoniae]
MKHITEEFSIGDSDYTAIITYDNSVHEKAPITIYIINQQDGNNPIMGDYIYTIENSSTYLNKASDGVDQLKSLNQHLVEKLKVPIYLSVSTSTSFSNVEMFQQIMRIIESSRR